jgi:predicted  nucleic acid-binding Zn-ribbon protein
MNDLLKDLARLQAIELKEIKEKDRDARIQELRGKIPPQIIGHYDRLMVRGKKGIIAVRNQVCTGCHMRLPIGVIMTLMKGTDIQLCDSCGRYLYLPDGENAPAPAEAPEPKAAVKRGRKKKVAPAD